MINLKKQIIKIGRMLPTCSFHNRYFEYVRMLLYSGYIEKRVQIEKTGAFTVEPTTKFVGYKHIHIASGHIRAYCRISAITKYNKEIFTPSILIGDNCNIGQNNHIGAINNISIGANFLSGANCLITDHYHGGGDEDLSVPPNDRSLYSKGPVKIGNNVHIGENVIILSGVSVGNNVVIGAGSVVTKSLPDNAIAAGNPAQVKRIVKNEYTSYRK